MKIGIFFRKIKDGAKAAIRGSLKRVGYRFQSLYDSVIDEDREFMAIYTKCQPLTLTTKERMYALYKAVRYIVQGGVAGHFVECGVWAGGSSMVMAETLLLAGERDRTIYLFDTFEGMTEQTDEDVHVEDATITECDPSCVPLDTVKCNMASTGYGKIEYVKGRVEETLVKSPLLGKIALLRLDTDWYESTKCELEIPFPLLSVGGVLIVDDYGAWAGAKKAVDEYFKDSRILLNRIDRDSVIGIKIR
ncbi:MAG: TylF/MycF/NovP-related O-methyltransferase [bacterium]|nr:TylF/MycF/NovP-related O-methyltransferase [bacterium]